MREAKIFFKNEEAATLRQLDDGSFVFEYNKAWFIDNSKPAISLTLSKNKINYTSAFLFPFFYNMLPEGINKQHICSRFRIEKDDNFSLLLQAAKNDTIGAVTIQKVKST